jgi:hypothetical protein
MKYYLDHALKSTVTVTVGSFEFVRLSENFLSEVKLQPTTRNQPIYKHIFEVVLLLICNLCHYFYIDENN